MEKFIKFFTLAIILGIFIAPIVFAWEINWPTSPMGTDLLPGSTLTEMVRYFYEWGIAIGGIAAFFALLFGGFLYLTSAGDPARLKEAKDRIFSALTGLALLLGSWIILNTINPELTVLRPPSLEPTKVEIAEELLEAALQKKSCEYVRLYAEPYWKGNSTTVEAEEDPIVVDVEGTFGEEGPKSVIFFQRCETNEVCKQIEDGSWKLHVLTTTTITTTTDTTPTTTVVTIEMPTEIICENLDQDLFGDINDDCVVNWIDLELCAAGDMRCDLDGDGDVDIVDIVKVAKQVGETCCRKEGGACILDLHEKEEEGWWIFKWHKKCGLKKGNTSGSLHNLKLAYYSDVYIKCVKVTKTGFEE